MPLLGGGHCFEATVRRYGRRRLRPRRRHRKDRSSIALGS